MSVLWMVRHGQASFGGDNYDRLSERGIEQSRILAAHIADIGAGFDTIYCGTIERQRHTAAEIVKACRGLGMALPDPRELGEFNEYDSRGIIMSQIQEVLDESPDLAGEVEKIYTDKKAFQRIFERVMLRWVTGLHDKAGVETWSQVKRRVASGLEAVKSANGRNKRVLVVASGGTISASVQYALGISDAETIQLSWQIVNSSVTRFMYNDDRITLSSFNAVSHLEIKRDKSLITYR